MKIKKFVAGLSAAVLAATMMSVSVSAAKLRRCCSSVRGGLKNE